MDARSLEIKALLDADVEKQPALFPGGYLVTSSEIKNTESFPFYGNWSGFFLGGLYIYCHKKEKVTSLVVGDVSMVIVGHAYNPFSMLYEEGDILEECMQSYVSVGVEGFFDKLSELTGVHVVFVMDGSSTLVVQDCVGLKACYYGVVNNDVMFTSHPQLLDDVYGLTRDENISLLMGKWFFSLGGRYLPGNLSPFVELSRLGPNTFIRYDGDFNLERFFPKAPHPELSDLDFSDTVSQIGQLLKANINLCARKWARPAISLSGGTDSRTTLACANGCYEKYKFYSFQSKPDETVDAASAKALCDTIGVRHTTYRIPGSDDEVADFDVFKMLILHNGSYIGNPKDNEIRKFSYFYHLNDFDVELKSWVSELGRLMWERKLNVTLPRRLSPRHFSIFQSRYFGSPLLLKHADDSYRAHLEEISLSRPLFNYSHADSFFWEFRDGGWGSNVVSMQDIFSHTVTIPFNNRKIVDMMLWFPPEKRKSDYFHSSVIKIMNKELCLDNVRPQKSSFRFKRVLLEKTFYYYRVILKWVNF